MIQAHTFLVPEFQRGTFKISWTAADVPSKFAYF